MVWTRRILVAAGAAAMVNAAIGLPSNLTIPKEQLNYLRFFVLAFVATLAVILPAVLGVGRLLGRYVPARFRAVGCRVPCSSLSWSSSSRCPL
jgi:hypothetical protein